MRYFATLGPNFNSVATLKKAKEIGITGLRLNLSHGLLKDRIEWINNVAQISSNDFTFEILLDIQGGEFRISISDDLSISIADIIIFSWEDLGYENQVLIDEIFIINTNLGDIIKLDDGKLELEVIEQSHNYFKAMALNDHHLKNKKSACIKDKIIIKDSLSADDYINLKLAKNLNINSFMIPFVRSKSDLIFIKEELKNIGFSDCRIYAKIEDNLGLDNLEDFIDFADEIVIARGDLANNLGLLAMPKIQKQISKTCKSRGKDFMVVTQLLDSMVDKPTPTRAELNDIYNSVLDGATSLMITGETAVGDYPLEACKYLVEGSKI